jgi:enoyl-CoA hydratase
MTQKIQVEKNGAVTTVIIDRPEVRNALDGDALHQLTTAMREFEADDGAKVAVLWGRGGAFCSGGDLKEIAKNPNYEPWAGARGNLLASPLSKPVIAAVSGYACSGGLALALWCDIRIAEQSSTFALLSRRWGVPMSDGTTVRLPRLIGTGRALDMMLTARKVGAAEAEQMGLVTRIVADGQSRSAAESLAQEMANYPQVAMRSDRQSALEQDGQPLQTAIRREDELSMQAREGAASEGAQVFAHGAGRHGRVG